MPYNITFKRYKDVEFLAPLGFLREHSILVVFTTRRGGISPAPFDSLNLAFHVGDNPDNVRSNRKLLCDALDLELSSLTSAEQVHQDLAVKVEHDLVGSGALGEEDAISSADALATSVKGVPLILFFADCVPIVLVDPVRRVVGVIHAGRVGTCLGIASSTIKLMKDSYGTISQDVVVFIGPSICPRCYGQDLLTENKLQLEKEGIFKKNIVSTEFCTSCNNDLFFSYHKEKSKTGRSVCDSTELVEVRTGRHCALVTLL